MPKKRRNCGRSKKNRGHVKSVRCGNCGRVVPKDKVIKKFVMRSMIDPAGMADFRSASVYESFIIPKFYQLLLYCVSCAVHAKIVHVRSREDRKIRNLPKPITDENKDKKIGPNSPKPISEKITHPAS